MQVWADSQYLRTSIATPQLTEPRAHRGIRSLQAHMQRNWACCDMSLTLLNKEQGWKKSQPGRFSKTKYIGPYSCMWAGAHIWAGPGAHIWARPIYAPHLDALEHDEGDCYVGLDEPSFRNLVNHIQITTTMKQ